MQPVMEAVNRLAAFNGERQAILAEVERRVVDRHVDAARRGGDRSLEYVLNEVAFQELRRLEGGHGSPAERRRIADWRALARQVGSMDEEAKRRRLMALVQEHALDVVGSFDPTVYRFARGALPSILTALLSPGRLREGPDARIDVDGPFDALRRCAERGTLVFTPTHSSNLDSVVLGWSLDLAALPPVTYGAGKNLFSNPFLSFFLRNLGAYRVDRRLRHSLYKDVVKEYSTVLLERGFHSLFFPGGTRSRSGAIERRLKLGLLGTAVTAYRNLLAAGRRDRRVYVVPVTINYAITLEAETLIGDFLAEEGKHRYIIEDDESSRLGRVVAFGRRVLAREGSVAIRFGWPLDPFGNAVDGQGESRDARGRRVDPARYLVGPGGEVADDPQRDAEYVRGLGDELLGAYRRLTLLLPTHLVARALFDAIAARQGTRDVYRLLRAEEGAVLPVVEVRRAVDALRDRVRAGPGLGSLPPRVAVMTPAEIVSEALASFRGYHERPVAEREGDQIAVRHLRLLVYYQNRTLALADEVGA